MAKTTYPSTRQQPVQILDFRLANGARVRTVLKPQPDASGRQVAHVDLDYTNAGSTWLMPVASQGQPRSVFQAGVLAYQIAQHEAQNAGGIGIDEAQLEGEEFLEVADVEQITGNSMPVTKF
ncbi:hypothetical protein ACFQ3P_43385 [Paraburkholderia sabiae]|uniref:Uncharacterized protein n=1 Tax=Paraburkholderia sabiae TaxID=273251 RepID=A0ABU9QSP9_9BURK|nr:hypothetical protein [Paraburkholderia sabiae]WJZ80000.1 hypothetical protein QEN71_43425 [Paraburkholderia sabiae]CAD6563374.1 hypothetical protein LMG24235_08618 [Paraburkholderia sabiae]